MLTLTLKPTTTEADSMKILRYLRKPSTRCLLKAVKRLLESADCFWMGARIEVGWLYHIHLFSFALKKDVPDVHLMEVPLFCRGKRNHGSNNPHLCHYGKGLFIVEIVRLCIAFCYESSFIAFDGAVGIILHFEYPSTVDCLLVR